MLSVIERARRYSAKCPGAVSGQGGHDATFHVAAALVHGFALGEAEALALLREWNQTCQPPWSEAELVHKVRSAATAQHSKPRGYLLGKAGAWQGTNGTERTAMRPVTNAKPAPVDPVAATERFLKGFRCGEADLCGASAVGVDGDPRFDAGLLARVLYRPGELLNFVTEFTTETDAAGKVKARPMGKGRTAERDALVTEWEQRGVEGSEAGGWLRMNPVDGQGIADANVTAFRFALLECDTLPLELQLALFAKLPLPIAAILSSGGRSVHAWVKVDAPDADDYRATVARMLAILGRLGVDGKNKNPSRLSRLPGARRVIGAVGDGVQRLLYLNPQPAERSILG